jgi:hypothetical protein
MGRTHRVRTPPDRLISHTEAEPIRALFDRYHVIYLHGDVHQNARQRIGAGNNFLSIQAGSSFEVREDKQPVNRLVWCVLDIRTKQIHIEPLSWSQRNFNTAFTSLRNRLGSVCIRVNRWQNADEISIFIRAISVSRIPGTSSWNRGVHSWTSLSARTAKYDLHRRQTATVA